MEYSRLTHFRCDDCKNMRTFIIIKFEVLTVGQCLRLGHETLVCAVCLTMSLLINYSFLDKSICAFPTDVFHCNFWHVHMIMSTTCHKQQSRQAGNNGGIFIHLLHRYSFRYFVSVKTFTHILQGPALPKVFFDMDSGWLVEAIF